MDIFINQKEYSSLTDEAGVRVVLTDQGRMPFPFDEGFSVPTGFSTSVGIRKVIELSQLNTIPFTVQIIFWLDFPWSNAFLSITSKIINLLFKFTSNVDKTLTAVTKFNNAILVSTAILRSTGSYPKTPKCNSDFP